MRTIVFSLFLLSLSLASAAAQTPAKWKVHDTARPKPEKVTGNLALPVPPPSDAKVLFDGGDLSNWRGADGEASKWIARDGYMESVAGSGYIFTKESFGDVQLHVEWASPATVKGDSQGRGNSGVFLMGLYEIQVLDSWDNPTYADGQASSVYGQHVPLVNAARKPGEWQSYDIVFRRPRFTIDGRLEKLARVTVFHNGVLTQDNVEPWGPTKWLQTSGYVKHPDRLPLSFQDHGNPVRFRNVWLRELDENPAPGPPSAPADPVITMKSEELDRYLGVYRNEQGLDFLTIRRDGSQMLAKFAYNPTPIDLVTNSETEWSLRWTAAKFVFDLDGKGRPTGAVFHIGGDEIPLKRVR